MPEEPPEPSNPPSAPSPESLAAQAKRLKSQALCVGTTRLIQESRYLREHNQHVIEEAEKLKGPPAKGSPKTKPKDRQKKG